MNCSLALQAACTEGGITLIPSKSSSSAGDLKPVHFSTLSFQSSSKIRKSHQEIFKQKLIILNYKSFCISGIISEPASLLLLSPMLFPDAVAVFVVVIGAGVVVIVVASVIIPNENKSNQQSKYYMLYINY